MYVVRLTTVAKHLLTQARQQHVSAQALVAKFNKRNDFNIPRGFQGFRKRFLVPVEPPFQLLRFGITLQLTTDIKLVQRALEASEEGSVGVDADDEALVRHPMIEALLPRLGGVKEEPEAAAAGAAAKAAPALPSMEALSSVLAAVKAKGGGKGGAAVPLHDGPRLAPPPAADARQPLPAPQGAAPAAGCRHAG